ncbi:hypothetical protein AB6C58_18140 [Vibrio splendidus]
MNYLEQLVYEYYDHLGHVVIRNRRVGLRENGGWEGELDIVTYNPETNEVLHVECSNDALSWENREARYKTKFEIGEKYIPDIFKHFDIKPKIKQQVLLGNVGKSERTTIGGGEIVTLPDFLEGCIMNMRWSYIHMSDMVVPEEYPLLRTVYYMTKHFNGVSFLDWN